MLEPKGEFSVMNLKLQKAFICTFLMLLTGCVVPKTYNQIAYKGVSKYQLFDEASWQSLDFQQIYYDDKTNIEVFFLRSANWWNEGDVGIISVFESVTKPTECPFTSRGGRCPFILYPNLSMFETRPYMGNGTLKETYRTDELALLSAEGDIESSYLLAAYQIYNEKRNAQVSSIMSRNNWGESDRFSAESKWYQQGTAHDELMAQRKISRNRTSSTPIKSYERASSYGSRVTKSGHSSTSKSSSSFLDTLIDAAITGWVHKTLDIPLPGEISESNLRKIEEASRRGMSRAIRKSNPQKRIKDLLKTRPKIGCESYGC
jgi:hypothetical protein